MVVWGRGVTADNVAEVFSTAVAIWKSGSEKEPEDISSNSYPCLRLFVPLLLHSRGSFDNVRHFIGMSLGAEISFSLEVRYGKKGRKGKAMTPHLTHHVFSE